MPASCGAVGNPDMLASNKVLSFKDRACEHRGGWHHGLRKRPRTQYRRLLYRQIRENTLVCLVSDHMR